MVCVATDVLTMAIVVVELPIFYKRKVSVVKMTWDVENLIGFSMNFEFEMKILCGFVGNVMLFLDLV